MSHSGSHHSSGSSHSGSHHSSGGTHSGTHHSSSSSGGSSSSTRYSSTKTPYYSYHSSSGSGYYSDDEIPRLATVYNGTWYYQNGELFKYDINMDDEYVREHYDYSKLNWISRLFKKSTSRFIIAFYVYGFIAFLLMVLCSLNVFYEALVPIIENAILSDHTFYLLDDMLYYGQHIAYILWIITIPIYVIRSFKKATDYEKSFVLEVIKHYQRKEQEEAEEYYAVCPSCNASVHEQDNKIKVKNCPYCGSSLKINKLQ